MLRSWRCSHTLCDRSNGGVLCGRQAEDEDGRVDAQKEKGPAEAQFCRRSDQIVSFVSLKFIVQCSRRNLFPPNERSSHARGCQMPVRLRFTSNVRTIGCFFCNRFHARPLSELGNLSSSWWRVSLRGALAVAEAVIVVAPSAVAAVAKHGKKKRKKK